MTAKEKTNSFGDWKVKMNVPKGYNNGAFIGDNSDFDEDEFLIGKGAKYEILKRDDINKVIEVNIIN